jgi:hypothetical protein
MAFFRRVYQVRATDSPNVRLGLLQEARGIKPTNEILVDGVISYSTYLQKRATLDPVRQCVGLDAEFYEGAEVLLFPIDWLNHAEEVARQLESSNPRRQVVTLGVDTAEGGDDTVFTGIDRLGTLFQEAFKTADTAVIVPKTIALIREHGIKPENVLFDRGGGGKQHVDILRMKGYNVRAIAFGEAATTPEAKDMSGLKSNNKVREEREAKYIYKNRRAEMYAEVRFLLLDPANNERGFGIPASMVELRRQLSPIPLLYDEEGRLYLPPKQRKAGSDSKQVTMQDLIGRSPDHADSFVLAVHGMFHHKVLKVLGAY